MMKAPVLALMMLALAACSPESTRTEATGKGTVRAINAIKGSPEIAFLIEERSAGSAAYKSSTSQREWDDLEYTFSFEVLFAGATETTRIASRLIDVVKDTDYTLVISGTLAAPDLMVWEAPRRAFTEGETVFEARFGHIAATEDPVDVYFAEPGVAPAVGGEIGRIAYGEVLAPSDFEAGEYVLTYTTAGDPDDILFQSDPVLAGERASLIFAVFDKDANDLTPLAVRLIDSGGSSGSVSDVNTPPTVQFVHASTALATSDIYVEDADDALTVPDIENHAFGDITANTPVFAGANFITYTTAMDTMSILFDSAATITASTRNRYVIVGDADSLTALDIRLDRRSIDTFARFNILHTALNHPSVDIYIIEQGAELAESLPFFFRVPPGIAPLSSDLRAGSFELYITSPDEDRTIIAGPYALETSTGDVIDLIVFDNQSDPAIADIVAFPAP